MEMAGQLHVSGALPREKSLPYPLVRWLGGPQGRSGRGGEEHKSGIELRSSSLYLSHYRNWGTQVSAWGYME
jgi:hypothetical protein